MGLMVTRVTHHEFSINFSIYDKFMTLTRFIRSEVDDNEHCVCRVKFRMYFKKINKISKELVCKLFKLCKLCKRVMIQIEVITLIQAEIDNESILITLNVR